VEIDEGDDETLDFDIRLPSNAAPGNYYFDMIAFYDNDEETDRVSEKEARRKGD
jgi:uncharacterized membrane protein